MSNILTVRQKDLVEILTEMSTIVTAKNLSGILGVSTKTIRNDIHQINTSFGEPIIESKPGQGFYMSAEKSTYITTKTVVSATNIQFEVLMKIIGKEDADYYQIADEFFISESTLDRIIKELNNVIVDRDPSFCIYRKENKLLIDGNEEQKRKIFNLFLNKELDNNRLSLVKYANYFDNCDLDNLSKLIVGYHKKTSFTINDFSTISFILHVAVLIERISKGNYIQIEKKTETFASPKVKELAKNLAKELENSLDITIPEQELVYLERLFTDRLTIKEETKVSTIQKVVEEILVSINSSYSIDFSLDPQLKGYLTNHLSALCSRAAKEHYLRNPLIEELKSQFPFIYNISVYASAIIQQKLMIYFPDEEIAYIALHFLSASETIKLNRKRKILFISPYGVAGQRLARKKLERISKFSVEVVSESTFHDVENLSTKDIHLIVTSENLPNIFDINIYKFNSFLCDDDIFKIEELLGKNQQEVNVLNQFFKEDLFFSHQSFKTKEEVIQFLCERLAEQDYCDEKYVDKVLERERLSSTSYGNYYALPHAITRCANKNGVAVCCLDKPIDWGGRRVKLVLLIAMKEERDNSFEKLFVQLVQILSEKNIVKKLAKQELFEDFLRLSQK